MNFRQNAVAQFTDLIDRLAETPTHHAGPDAVDKRLGKPRIFWADDPIGQFGSPRNIAAAQLDLARRKGDRLHFVLAAFHLVLAAGLARNDDLARIVPRQLSVHADKEGGDVVKRLLRHLD